MGGSGLDLVILVVLAALCAAGVAWALLHPYISGSARAEKRMRSVQKPAAVKTTRRNELVEAQKRRKVVQDTLSELEARQRQRTRPSLKVRLQQAGLGWSPNGFYVFSAILGLLFGLAGLILGSPFGVIVLLAFVGGIGLPQWLLRFLTNRRKKKFLEEFPNAVDIVVRGVKAGLPLNDCLRMVSAESPAPVGPEFRHLIETQAVGLPLADCVERMYDRMPLPEVNFFAIVVAIQQKSGGNLSEALGNLSAVLRERKKMKQKIIAMSQEAKASAAIIGSLPIIVMILVFLTSPDYISLLWTETLGKLMLMGSAVWMMLGVLVMRKMINFDF
jgi:tight adherence protein B